MKLSMKKAIICDLDGTLVKTNTFNLFTLYMLRHLSSSLPVLITVARRKLRLISHASAKQALLRIANKHFVKSDYELFAADIISHYLRDSVKSLVDNEKKSGCPALLATAAPEVYADYIARITGFDGCVATQLGGAENSGNEKVSRVKEWLADNNAELGVVITDHADDLPLMQLAAASGAVIWLVNPSGNTVARTRHLNPQII